jgi:hypothetical protein
VSNPDDANPTEGIGATEAIDVGEYCRSVEQHLTRVNAGQLVRIFGPGFELVRTWAHEGVPLSIVLHGISLKAERHHAGGRAARPLRLEFCEADVRAVFEQWRRAVGIWSAAPAPTAPSATLADVPEPGDEPRRGSLSKHLDRAADRLSRAAGRLELPEEFRDVLSRLLDEVVALKEQARKARGPIRDTLAATLPGLDVQLASAARRAIDAGELAAIEADAVADLAPYRARLGPDVWKRSVEVTTDRLLRDRLGLPVLEFS